jgi:hypothetical protein
MADEEEEITYKTAEGLALNAADAQRRRVKTKAKAKAKLKTSEGDLGFSSSAGAGRGGRASFLVKIWQSDEADADAEDKIGAPAHFGWRGVVEHIQSGSKITFADETDLFNFMTEHARRQQNLVLDEEDIDQFSPLVDD